MTVSVDTNWKYDELQTVILENEKLKVILFPSLGAKIWQITYKPNDKDLLWHHPRMKPREIPFNSVYDDHFFGGWDEVFPNDSIEIIAGEQEPDHGELWALPWEYTIEKNTPEEIIIHLEVSTAICSTRLDKWITLKSGECKLHFHHKITNTGLHEFPFLWKVHAAMAIDDKCRIDLPAAMMHIEDFGHTRINPAKAAYNWPNAVDAEGKVHDMRIIPAETSAICEFQYATEMAAGWCALTHIEDKVGFALVFNLESLPTCWVFATYGGWCNLNTLVLEPCSGYPLSVNEGHKQGTHLSLAPGRSWEFDLMAVVYEGYSAVHSIDLNGHITGER